MRILAVVQARMGSSRLPGKSMMQLAGKPLVEHVLERAGAISGVDDVVLATSINDRDAPLAALAANLGYRFWRGSEHDVLGRFAHVAATMDADWIVRITGDCPFTAPEICGRLVISARVEPWWDYITNDTLCSGYPDGTDVEVFSRAALERADAAAVHHTDREHVTPWMRRHLPTHTIRSTGEDLRHMKLSVDCEEDLARARAIAGYLPRNDFTLAATVRAYYQAFSMPEEAV